MSPRMPRRARWSSSLRRVRRPGIVAGCELAASHRAAITEGGDRREGVGTGEKGDDSRFLWYY
jgi:hypothetical protein